MIIPLIFLGSIIIAQAPHPHFHNYTSDDGLPSSEVHEIFQDSRDYIWFGTDNGLSRFDGYNFKNYSGQEGLKNPVVFDIKEDDNNRLWMLTMSGNIYIMEKDSIYPFKYNHLITKNKEKYFRAQEFQFDEDRRYIFISLVHNGILMIDLLSGECKSINTPMTSHFVFDSIGVKMISNSNYEDTYYQSKYTIPVSFIYTDKRTLGIQLKRYSFASGYSLLALNDSMTISGIGGTEALYKHDNLQWTKPITNTYVCALKYKNNYWLGANSNDGIKIFESIDDIKKENYVTILDGISISKMFLDNKNGLWISTTDKGVFYSANPDHLVYDIESGLDDNFIKSISTKSSNNMIICTWKGSLYEWNMNSNTIINKMQNPNKESVYNYDVLYANETNNLLFGPSSIILQNGISYPLKYVQYKSVRPYVGLKKISSNIHNNKCIINASSNLFVCDLKANTIINDLNKNKHSNIRHLDANFDNQGDIWVSRVDGLWLWKGDSLIRPQPMFDILRRRIEAVEFLGDNVILGTKGNGVLLWDKRNEPIIINTKKGLSADNIENIYVDNEGIVWVGTLNGLNRINFLKNDEPIIKVFTKKHGLPINEITKVRRQGENIYIATTKGLMRMKDYKDNKTTVTPFMRSIIVNGKVYKQSSDIQLNHDENDIEFRFLCIDFKAKGEISYRYKIRRDKEWKYTPQTNLSFPNIGSGSYSLEIQSQNEDGYWSESLIQSFEVLKPFWKKDWFTLLCISILGMISYYFYRRKHKEINRKIDYKTKLIELERSALQAQMNPHFIFNVLNSIQNSINSKQPQKASQDLAKFAKLIRSTLNNARLKEISLDEELSYIESYLALERLRFKNKFNFEVTFQENLDTFNIYIPPMLTQPFVENAIKHGINNSDSGMIKVHYKLYNQKLLISIKDNGIGYNPNQKSKHNYESTGMSITKRRLELLSTDKNKENIIKINEVKNEQGKVEGTEIIILVEIK